MALFGNKNYSPKGKYTVSLIALYFSLYIECMENQLLITQTKVYATELNNFYLKFKICELLIVFLQIFPSPTQVGYHDTTTNN
jgi:hypothetical protein